MSEAKNVPDRHPVPEFRTIMGHPSPLWMLFMSEFWERFAFYGIRWALVLYIVSQFYGGDQSGQADANLTYGSYLALVYAGAIFGGYIADKIIGYQRSILVGAVFMAAGLFMIMLPDPVLFRFGLATVIVGNGMFKPNISTMVGKLYSIADERRDSGFTIFYMGINMGAFIAPIITGWLATAVFGTDAAFPSKYQHALYILDWTFGTIYAVHLVPEGASYRGELEPFVYGEPLPVTDGVIGKDGA